MGVLLSEADALVPTGMRDPAVTPTDHRKGPRLPAKHLHDDREGGGGVHLSRTSSQPGCCSLHCTRAPRRPEKASDRGPLWRAHCVPALPAAELGSASGGTGGSGGGKAPLQPRRALGSLYGEWNPRVQLRVTDQENLVCPPCRMHLPPLPTLPPRHHCQHCHPTTTANTATCYPATTAATAATWHLATTATSHLPPSLGAVPAPPPPPPPPL
jgi:hypothetical protein